MQIATRVFSPTQFDRSQSLGRPATAAPAAAAPPPPNLDNLASRVQDSLSLGQGLPEGASRSVGQLNEALQSLRQLTGSGPNASLSSVLERFQSETLPQNLTALQSSVSDLQTRLDALPAESPERQALSLQLQATQGILELYTQAESVLSSSPLLNASAISAAEPVAGPPAQPPVDLPALLSDAVIPPQQGRNFSALDAFYTNPQSSQTIFNQRQTELSNHVETLSAQIQQGGPPEEIARLERSRALLQNLSELYGSIGSLDGTGSRGIQADVSELSAKLQAASELLSAGAADIDPETFGRLQGQLSDLNAITTTYLQLKDQPAAERPEHNLGRFINTTYKRLGQIETGQRARANEPATVAGALQTYLNDKSDIVTFIQRFSSLRDQIRGGLSGPAARDAALRSIPGTSPAFQTAFLNLVNAEVSLEAARQRNLEAQAALTRADAAAGQAQGQIAEANGQITQGRAASQQAGAAAGRGDYPGARQANGQASGYRDTAAAGLERAQGNLSLATRERASAGQSLSSARSLTASANTDISQAEASAFGRQLTEPIGSARGRSTQVSSEIASTEVQAAATDALIASTQSELTVASTANQTLTSEITATDQAIVRGEEALRRQQAQNEGELNQLASLLSSNAGKFSLELTAGITVGGGGVEGSAQLVTSINGSKELDGSYTLSVRFGGEVSGKVKAWLVDIEAKARFEGVGGIRLRDAAQVREFSRLVNEVTNSLGQHGLTSSEAANAREELLNFIELTRQTGTVQTYELTASTGSKDSKRGGKGKVTVENLTQHNFTDTNQNGRRDPGEALTVDRTRGVSVEASYVRGSQQYGVTGKFVHYDDGRLKSQQIGIIIPSLNINGDVIRDVKPVLVQAGLPTDLIDSPEVEQGLRRLRATKGEFKSDAVISFNITEKDGKRSVTLTATSRNTLDLRGSIPTSPGVSATAGLKGSLDYSQVFPLSD